VAARERNDGACPSGSDDTAALQVQLAREVGLERSTAILSPNTFFPKGARS
jgi:hypothetical protein